MQSDAWFAFATDDVRAMNRAPELLADADGDACSADTTPPICIECLARTLQRSTGDVVDEVMASYSRFEVTLSEAGHCHVCSRRTVVVE
jgi:hypothetical protein